MKLGTKITVGFATLIALAMLLGGVAVWKMSVVKRNAINLAEDFMPAATVAKDVERMAAQTMYEVRGYAYSEDTNFLAKAKQNMAEVFRHLDAADTLAARDKEGHLAALKTATSQARSRAQEYEQLSERTVAVTERLLRLREEMNEAARQFVAASTGYIDSQNAALQKLLAASNSVTDLVVGVQDRVAKINLANEVLTLGNGIRVGNFRAQATRDPETFRTAQQHFATVEQKLTALQAITKHEVNLQQIEKCRAAARSYEASMAEFLKFWLEREALAGQRVIAGNAVMAEANQTAATCMKTASTTSEDAAGELSAAATTMIVGLGLALVIGATFAWFLIRSITGPIRAVADQLSGGAAQTASAAGQVSAASQSLAEGTSEQAASLEETSSSLEEMASMTKRNAENAQKANQLAKETRTAAERGSHDMQAMTAAMEAIKTSSDDVAKIIKTIDEIAFQTNILALNAAVEAARAGEAGMGFAVVADEVRSLAQRSALAAKETATKIESAIAKTAQGVEISSKVAETLTAIVSRAREVDELAAEVAGASGEQTQGISQINTAVCQMDKVTQTNAANAEESAAAAEEMNAQAEAMKEAVNELLRLVDGQQAVGAVKLATPAARKNPAPPPPAPNLDKLDEVMAAAAGASKAAPTVKPRDGKSTKAAPVAAAGSSFNDF